MKNPTVINSLGVVILFVGVLVILGYFFDIEFLKSIISDGPTMKFGTALSFACTGVALFFIAKMQKGKTTLAQIGLPALVLIIVMFLTVNTVSVLLGSNIGLATLFEKGSQSISTPNIPSLGTSVAFTLISVSLFLIMTDFSKARKITSGIGVVIAAISGIAIVGFALGMPYLYYDFGWIGSAMAFHTAISFFLSGVALTLIGKDKEKAPSVETAQIKTRLVSLFLIISTIPISFLGIMTYLLIRDLEVVGTVGYSFTIISVIGICASILFTYIVTRQIIMPIILLKNTALAVSQGNLDVKAEESTTDEVGQLAKTFNSMIENIKASNALEKEQLQQKQESLNAISQITNALDEAALVSITDKNGIIIEANPKFCEVSKYSLEELIGKNHRIIKSGFHPPEFYEDLWKTISSGKIWSKDIKNCAKDGTYYWVKTVIVPFFTMDGQIEKYVSIRTDITEQKRIEAELREKIKTEFELGKTIGEQKRIEAELREKDVEKEEFSAMVSHELKTPLIPISGYAELFLDGSLGPLTPTQKEKLQIMYENSIRLTTLIQDILDARKIELGKLKLDIQSESIKQIVTRSLDIFRPISEQKGITMTDQTSDTIVRCDPDRILQILNNLISNAIKFVPTKAGAISINSRNENNTVVVGVIDNGPGIPKSKQDDLFKKFYQVDKTLTRQSGGTGLGLAISKGIIESHGGKIWVESEENMGTRVYFTLPMENHT